MMKKILVVSGPNINLLGIRDKTQYGEITYKELLSLIQNEFKDISFEFFQSNHEGVLIDQFQDAISRKYTGVIINLGGYSHTSIALRDVISLINTLKVEVHLSNIYERETFRQISVIKDVCDHQIVGLKEQGYLEAVRWILNESKE